MADLNPLYDPSTDNVSIDPTTQEMLNKPALSAFTEEEQMFLNLLMSKVEDKSINLYSPSSLLNEAVYATLSMEARGKADQNTVILLGKIRDIYNLMQAYKEPNMVIKNLVAALFEVKKRLEEHDDLFVI